MKQFLIRLLFVVVLFTPGIVVRAAGSATMTLDALSYEATRGEQFDVTVSVNPQGESLDTVRSVVTFDPSVLTVQGVRLVGSFDRVAPGNYYDNVNGKISWGAFTLEDPVTTQVPFMTITFLPIASGEGDIQISSDSRAISNGEERINIASLGEAKVEVVESQEAEPGVALLVAQSTSHQNENTWYANRIIDVSWTQLEGDTALSAYYYSFGQDSDEDPGIYLDADLTQLTLEALQDGLYYFRLKGVQANGRETAVVHRIVRVDTTAPNPIELTVVDDKILEGESAWFTFATTDETSGVVEYQVAINDSEFQVQTSPLEMEDLPAGTYFFRVAALDRAGNSISGGVSVRVYPQGTDLSRPDGYEESVEVQAVTQTIEEIGEEVSSDRTLLITVVLGAITLFAIIYLAHRRKK